MSELLQIDVTDKNNKSRINTDKRQTAFAGVVRPVRTFGNSPRGKKISFLPHKRHCVSEFANKFAACRIGVRESVGDARARFTVVAADRPANGQSPSMLFIEGLWFGERTSARYSGVISQQPRTDLRSCMPCFFARYSPPPQHLSRSLRHPRHSLLAVLSPLFCPSSARLRHR